MSIANYLVNLTDGLTSQGVLGSSKGGTGLTTVGSSGQAIVSDGTYWVSQTVASGAPKVSQISYVGDNTAANPTGGETVTLTGTGFATGARVLINQTQVGVVTVVSATQITFTTPALATGSYVLYVVNTDGGTAVVVPGIQVSGVPSWTTAAGTLGTVYETAAIATTVAATSDSAVTYSVISGALPTGATLAANGTISGTSPVTASSTTYTFVIRANDAENQETDRTFNLTINPDVVTWSSPANAAALVATPGVVYSSALSAASAAGKTITYSANALPAGLAISGATITGTPTTAGTSSTTLTATSAVTNKTAQVTISWTITVAADAYFPLTTLLLNSETTAVPFTADASTNNFALTVNGDTKPSNFNPYTPGYYSNYFDGSGDYLSIPTGAAAAFGTTGTVEFWYYPTTSPAIARIINNSTAATTGMDVYDSSSVIGFSNAGYTTTTVKLNTWTHIACVINAGVLKIYFNGVSQPLAGATTGYNLTATGDVWVGGINGYSQWTSGYISNLRFVKGTAVYTSDFTPSTTPLTAVANTSLLTCQSNRLLDNSANAFAVTKTGDVAVSSFDPFVPNTSYATYGSTYFDGTGDTLSLPFSSAISLGTGDFTMEAWCYPTTTTNGIDSLWGSSNYSVMLYHSGTSWTLEVGEGGSNYFTINATAPIYAWNHIAVTRSGSNFNLWVNGVSAGTGTTAGTMKTSGTLTIGGNGNGQNFTGYISNYRLIKGTAVYTTAFTPPATPLTAITNTALLTCQTAQPVNNQTFLDNSSNAFPVTRSGNATQGSFSPYGANWSNYFDGTGDSLTATGNTSLAFGTGDFTVEAWLYQTVANTYPTVLEIGNHLQTDGILFINYGTTVAIYSGAFYGTNTTTLNAWNHVAWVRSSGVLKIYVNGVGGTGVSFTNNLTTNTPYIGLSPNGGTGYTYTGYISNLRAVKGTAVYTSNFTPSTQPLTPITGTSLLTCQAPNLVDNSLNAFTLTKAGDVSVQKFNPFATVTQTPNTHSTYFDGTGDYLTLPSSSNLVFGTGDFCVEMWYYQQANAVAALFSNAVSAGGGDAQFELQIAASTFYPTVLAWATTFLTSSVASTPNAWNHIAVCRSGTTLSMFLNGTRTATTTTSNNFSSTNAFHISRQAAAAAGYINGYISNLRVVKGSSVYTPSATTITVPTQPLTAITNTQLLTCQSATLTDNSTNAFALTAFGDTKPRQQNPFGFTTSSTQDYSTTTFGGSAYFDGSSDYISIPNSALHATLPGNFTAECWFYLNNVTGTQLIFSHRTNGYCPFLIWASTTSLVLYVSSDNGSWNIINGDSIATVAAGQWYHLAYTRTGSTFRVFLNGIQVKTFSSSASFTTPNSLQLGMSTTETNSALNGYISDFRFVNGTGVYTANFVPPQAPLTAVQNTTLLLNMDKSAIADKSGKAVLESVGDTKVSTAIKKYGNSSMYFDGSADRLSTSPGVINSLGSGDFTIEGWAYPLSLSSMRILSQGTSTTGEFLFILNSNGSADFCEATTSKVAFSAGSFVVGEWKHFAIVRSGSGSNNLKGYINGTLAGTGTSSSYNFSATTSIFVGSNPATASQDFQGYIDDLRITRGYARYTANFTPPTSTLITK